MAGLPDISLSDTKKAPTVAELKEECENVLSDSDKKLMFYFFLKYDCQNIVRLLKNPDAQLLANGNFSLEQYQDLITSAKEMNFNVHRYPTFMSIYAREYSYNKDTAGFFAEDAMMLEYYKYAMGCSNKMIADWYEFNFNVTNILTAMIARKNGWNVGDFIQGDNEVTEIIRTNNSKDFSLSTEYDYVADLMKVVDETDPVQKEKKIDAFKWSWLDERTFFDIFSIDAVFAYFCKLEMLERWEHLDVEEGKETFKQIIENLRGEAKVPEEFVR
jgi:hypothetical protein